MLFRYCDKNGNVADGKYPANPTGAFHDIAGICNREGNIFGSMPHPRRAIVLVAATRLDTRRQLLQYGDGRLIFRTARLTI